MGSTPDEIRTDIERTRAGLAGDVDQLVDRTSPRRIARRRTARVRGAFQNARTKVMGASGSAAQHTQATGHQAAGTVRNTAQATREGAGQAVDAVKSAPGQVARQTEGNPLAAGVIAFGAGLLAATLIPTSRTEQQAAGQVTDRAADAMEPVKQAMTESAQRVGDEAKSAGRDAAEQVKATAAQAAQTTGEEARGQARQVQGQARDSAQSVREQREM